MFSGRLPLLRPSAPAASRSSPIYVDLNRSIDHVRGSRYDPLRGRVQREMQAREKFRITSGSGEIVLLVSSALPLPIFRSSENRNTLSGEGKPANSIEAPRNLSLSLSLSISLHLSVYLPMSYVFPERSQFLPSYLLQNYLIN